MWSLVNHFEKQEDALKKLLCILDSALDCAFGFCLVAHEWISSFILHVYWVSTKYRGKNIDLETSKREKKG